MARGTARRTRSDARRWLGAVDRPRLEMSLTGTRPSDKTWQVCEDCIGTSPRGSDVRVRSAIRHALLARRFTSDPHTGPPGATWTPSP